MFCSACPSLELTNCTFKRPMVRGLSARQRSRPDATLTPFSPRPAALAQWPDEHMELCFVKGSTIRYVLIPDEVDIGALVQTKAAALVEESEILARKLSRPKRPPSQMAPVPSLNEKGGS